MAHRKSSSSVSRRSFIRVVGAGAAIAGGLGSSAFAAPAEKADKPKDSESLVKLFYETLKPEQRAKMCFDWEHVDPKLGLLRTRIAANWHVSSPRIKSDFYTADQQRMIRDIFVGLVQPEWVAKFDKQLADDAEGFGDQSIGIFGHPGDGKFQFALTGRHITIRCDGHSADHVAFGGPIVYGHAASGFREKPEHPGNVFWFQAVAANDVYKTLDGRQQQQALIKKAPAEHAIGFQGKEGKFPGIPLTEMTPDQRKRMQEILQKLIEPYRQSDRDRAVACLKAQGGLDACSLAFYEEGDLGNDKVWDIWRVEGPALVWHFRGSPHVHTWVHVADDPSVKLNS